MDYYEITKAIRMKLEYVHAAAGEKDADNISFDIPDIYKSDFEDIICDYVDALAEVMKVRNANKRAILIMDALGYNQDAMADVLHIKQPSVNENLGWLKRFFSKVPIE